MSDPVGLNPRGWSAMYRSVGVVCPAARSGCDQQFLDNRDPAAGLYTPLPFDLALAKSNRESRRAESDRVEFSCHPMPSPKIDRGPQPAPRAPLDVTA